MNDPASHKASQGAVTPANHDRVLLRRYAEEGSEAAFTELVRRHVDLVYGAALRRTGGDPHRAADVAQQVFVALARDARKLSRHAVLGAWLHTATRNAALNLMISAQRRQARELQALALNPAFANDGASPDWDRVRPVLDAAIDELPEADRAAVVLRFLERRAFAEIGAALQVSEDAARMRTDRALDKLRAALARRGITSTAAALGAIVSSQPLVSAPAGLATALASASLAATGAGAGLLTATLVSFMTTKITALVAGSLVVFGLGFYLGLNRDASVPAPPPHSTPSDAPMLASVREDNLALKAETEKLRGQVSQLTAANAQLEAQLATPPPPAAPVVAPRGPTLGMARWEVQQAALNNLRQIDAARKQFQLEKGQHADSINDLVGRGSYIKAVRTVNGEDYSNLSMDPAQPLTVTTPDGISVTYDPTGVNTTRPEIPPEIARAQELAAKVQPSVMQAVNAYRAANNGGNPPNEQALMPYFPSPQEAASFVELLEAQKAAAGE
jgi:RNA polymerase sigma factor (sigma-70 family)